MEITMIRNRITDLFSSKPQNLLSVYYTAGYPSLDDTIALAEHLEKAGADVLEIGIPFSDPVADGPTIQDSNKIALQNGISVKKIIEQVSVIRQSVSLPIILMGYLNPVMQYGMERFCDDAAKAGADGLILPDMPADEYESDYRGLFESHHLCNSFLISPTTSPERIRKIDSISTGFIYAVSASSTTGAKGSFSDDQLSYFKRIKEMELANPLMIGFGISNHDTFSTACKFGAGAIVGSAFINLLKSSTDFEKDIPLFVQSLKKS